MNAERLNAICLELQKEMDDLNLEKHLEKVVSSLSNVVNQPQQSNLQNVLTNSLNVLYDALSDSPSDSFSPVYRQTLEEIDGANLLGENIAERVRKILERNQITPASALEEIREILEAFKQFKSAIDNIVEGFQSLHVGSEELEPGECELGILVPRHAVKSNLNLFGKELQELNFIFGTFSEVASGQRENYQIKSISSTNLAVFLALVPSVAACIAYAAEKIINLYKTLLEIRIYKAKLKAIGLNETAMKGITNHANSFMDKGIKKISVEVINNFFVGNDQDRKNELKNGVTIALNKIANRIDEGFNLEIRIEPLPEPEEEGGESEITAGEEEIRKYLSIVQKASKSLQFLKLEGTRILHLPENAPKSKTDKNK